MNKDIDFTVYSEDIFYDTVDTETFQNEDAESIYEHLYSKLQLIPFGDYLKRYIFLKAGFEGKYDEVDLKEYQSIIVDSFSENQTPKAFAETSSKISALSKNWLTQMSVSRKTVFLLGFGLGMSLQDVSSFLTHAQRERDFDFKNPFEIICWYCFKNEYKFPKFRQLYSAYEDLSTETDARYFSSSTIDLNRMFVSISNDDDLLAELSHIKTENSGKLYSVSARKAFDNLYSKVRRIIAEKFTEDSACEMEEKAREYLNKAQHSDFLSPEEQRIRAIRIRSSAKIFEEEDITESDVEKFLCCGQPFDKKGNLTKFSSSKLSKHFDNKRMSRQHINEIINNNVSVDRFDIITLNFFIFAMDESFDNNKKRYIEFVEDTNQILKETLMGELYITNPYECFLLMCILSDYPMGAYADVMEKSFEIK